MSSEFDLDGFIEESAESLRVKHEKIPESRISREIKRVASEQNAREKITRVLGPKMTYRDKGQEIVIPRYRSWPSG